MEEIKQRLDIVDTINEYVSLKKTGSNFTGLCPFHQEKTPSFMVSQSKQIWHCFGCHEGGDVFSFVQRIEGLEFFDTLKLLAERAGVTIQKSDFIKPDSKNRLLEVLEISARFFHKILLKHPKADKAREYIKERGLSEQTVEHFQIGYAPDSWEVLLKFLMSRGYHQQEIIDAGLVVYNQERNSLYDRFRNRVVIPLSDVHGNVVGFTARAVDPNFTGGKYINTPQTIVYDKSLVVFGIDKAKKAIKDLGYAVIVEGNMDVISSHQANILPVVAVSGTALTSQQIGLLKRFTNVCIFAFDADDAGLKASRRGVELALQAGMDVKVLTLPYGKDPDDCIRKDPALWQNAINQALPVIDYLIESGIQKNDILTPNGKKTVANDVLSLVVMLKSPVEKDHYLQKLSNEIQVAYQSLRETLALFNKQPVGTGVEKKVEVDNPAQTPGRTASWDVMSLIVKDTALLDDIESIEEYLETDQLLLLYKKLKNFYDKSAKTSEKSFNIDDFSKDQDNDSQTLITHLFLYGDKEFAGLTSHESRDAYMARIKFLKRRYLQSQLQKLQKEMQDAEKRKDSNAIKRLSGIFSDISYKILQLD